MSESGPPFFYIHYTLRQWVSSLTSGELFSKTDEQLFLLCIFVDINCFFPTIIGVITYFYLCISADLLRMFFDALYDEDVIKEEAFYKWESSKDPAEQTGKGVALKSVTAFFTWLREAEEESDKD